MALFATHTHQVDQLVNQKMGLHWDLLSLQDPNDPHKSSNTSISSASQPKGMPIRRTRTRTRTRTLTTYPSISSASAVQGWAAPALDSLQP